MIVVTRLNGEEFVLNAVLVERLEATPDTVITLTNGGKYVVQESVETVVERIRAWHSRVLHTVTVSDSQGGHRQLHVVTDEERG